MTDAEIDALSGAIADCIKIDGEVREKTIAYVIRTWIACGGPKPTTKDAPQAQG